MPSDRLVPRAADDLPAVLHVEVGARVDLGDVELAAPLVRFHGRAKRPVAAHAAPAPEPGVGAVVEVALHAVYGRVVRGDVGVGARHAVDVRALQHGVGGQVAALLDAGRLHEVAEERPHDHAPLHGRLHGGGEVDDGLGAHGVEGAVEGEHVPLDGRVAEQAVGVVHPLAHGGDRPGHALHRRAVVGHEIVAPDVPLLGVAVDGEVAHHARRERARLDERHERAEHLGRLAPPGLGGVRDLFGFDDRRKPLVALGERHALVLEHVPGAPGIAVAEHADLLRVRILPPDGRDEVHAREEVRVRVAHEQAAHVVFEGREVVLARARPRGRHPEVGLDEPDAHRVEIGERPGEQRCAEPPEGHLFLAVDEQARPAPLHAHLGAALGLAPDPIKGRAHLRRRDVAEGLGAGKHEVGRRKGDRAGGHPHAVYEGAAVHHRRKGEGQRAMARHGSGGKVSWRYGRRRRRGKAPAVRPPAVGPPRCSATAPPVAAPGCFALSLTA